MAADAHAGFHACESSSSGTKNNVFNSSATNVGAGGALCSVSGTIMDCDLTRVCGSGDTKNEVELVNNKGSTYITDSLSIRLRCNTVGTTVEYCSVYEDTGPSIDEVRLKGTDNQDWMAIEHSLSGTVMEDFVGSGGPQIEVKLCGYGDHDVIVGSTDATNYTEYLYGGDGPDHVLAQGGNDYAYGEDGNDFVDCGPNDDRCEGGAGDDWVVGGIGIDEAYGNGGNDTICLSTRTGGPTGLGSRGGPSYTGSEDEDWTSWTVGCASGNPVASGGPERAEGGAGNDTITLDGYKGDVLGGTGLDIVYGSENGADRFCDPANEDDESYGGTTRSEFRPTSNISGPALVDFLRGGGDAHTRSGITFINVTLGTPAACPF